MSLKLVGILTLAVLFHCAWLPRVAAAETQLPECVGKLGQAGLDEYLKSHPDASSDALEAQAKDYVPSLTHKLGGLPTIVALRSFL